MPPVVVRPLPGARDQRDGLGASDETFSAVIWRGEGGREGGRERAGNEGFLFYIRKRGNGYDCHKYEKTSSALQPSNHCQFGRHHHQ